MRTLMINEFYYEGKIRHDIVELGVLSFVPNCQISVYCHLHIE